ncbi:trypsin-like serine peptidase [Kineococcus terrestris]|uniref:trypsin-like serine peptidase n=1 Tax=Kineococcus terrestris TaxID=2044856 RepID=UPI0034DB165D
MPENAPRRRTAGLAAPLSLAAGLALLPVAPAAAAPAAPATATLLATTGEAGQEAAAEYWTPERMAAARPADPAPAAVADLQPPAPAGGPAQAAPRPLADATPAAADAAVPRRGRPLAQAAAAPVTRATAWTSGGAVAQRVGRLYFTRSGEDFVCSGTSVRAANESVVMTAGHCVTSGGSPSENVVFVPGLRGGAEPYGRWPARSTFTTASWASQDQSVPPGLNFDVGFAVVGPRAGRTLTATVGAFPVGFDAPLDGVTVFGYPAASGTSDGRTLQFCRGLRFADLRGSTDGATNCTLGGGASGGPWLSRFDPATGEGTVTSVTSFAYEDDPTVLYGPRLGAEARAAFDEAAAARP